MTFGTTLVVLKIPHVIVVMMHYAILLKVAVLLQKQIVDERHVVLQHL